MFYVYFICGENLVFVYNVVLNSVIKVYKYLSL